jgi:hypothetical protein
MGNSVKNVKLVLDGHFAKPALRHISNFIVETQLPNDFPTTIGRNAVPQTLKPFTLTHHVVSPSKKN